MQKIVKGVGPEGAKIFIIGEAPGANEEEKGIPFVGGAGQVLDGILSEVGITRASCKIDNVVQSRPADNDFSVYYNGHSPKEDLLTAHKRIREELRRSKPNVVALLGNEALFAITGKKGIQKWRGSILEWEGIKVIPTIHPAAIMRQYELRIQSVFDWTRILEESASPIMPEKIEERYLINPTFEQVMGALQDLKCKEYLSFDIETSIQNNQITCIGFAWSPSDAICIPICYGPKSYWTVAEELEITKGVKALLESGVKLIAQNVQFDWTFLQDQWNVDVHKCNLWMDTMIAHHCIYPEMPKSLAFLMSIYTKRPYHKDIAFDGGDASSLWFYNCNDCTGTWQVAFEIQREAEEWGTWTFYQEHSNKLIKPLFGMQTRGVLIDVDKRAKIDTNLSAELISLQERINLVVGHELNPNSPKQMKEFLYKELAFPPILNKEGNQTTDEDALEELNKRFPSPVFSLILDFRGVRKLLSTYVRAPLDRDSRIRCNYSLTGTETGRLSSRESIYGTGTNLQNIPRGELIRSIFIPDKEKIFVNADLSQAEARVVAYLANEDRLQRVFEEGGDIHKKNASRVFGIREEAVTNEQRELAKVLVHACNYKIGKRRFSKVANVTESKAQELINQYFALFPNIKNWHQEVEYNLHKTRTLRTPFGRKRAFFGRWNDELIRSAISYIPQSTVGDLLNLSLVRMWNASPNGWELLLQNHDAVLFQVPEETDPIHLYKYFHHYMEIPITINDKTFIIPVDIKIGEDWGHLKKLVI